MDVDGVSLRVYDCAGQVKALWLAPICYFYALWREALYGVIEGR